MYRRMQRWQFWTIILSMLLVNFTVSWTVVRLSERKWCELVSTLDAGYGEPVAGAAPLSPRGEKIARDIHDLRVRRLKC